jgi:hypothetical protein
MTAPEEALERARAAAAAERERPGSPYAEVSSGMRIEPTDTDASTRLLEWALIEPDPEKVYSTRRLGAPITGVKRLLLRALHQYHGELVAQQTRFNLEAVQHIRALEDRVAQLEQRLRDSSEPR